MDFISSTFRGLVNLELGNWISFLIPIVLVFIFLYRKNQKKYLVTLQNGEVVSAKQILQTSEYYWFIRNLEIPDFVALYRKLAETKYSSKINLEKAASEYLSEKIKVLRLSSIFQIYKLYRALKDSEKVHSNHLYDLMLAYLKFYDSKLVVSDSGIDSDMYHFDNLQKFSKDLKDFDATNEFLMDFLLSFAPSVAKKIESIHDFVSDENKFKRYLQLKTNLLSFDKISDLPAAILLFKEELSRKCGHAFLENVDADIREVISKKLLQMMDYADNKNTLGGLKNLKELFDILGEYLIPEDLMNLYLEIAKPKKG